MFQRDLQPASFKLKPKNAKARQNQTQVRVNLENQKLFPKAKNSRGVYVQL